jgi:K+-sensing histidine kinase KdpD
MMEKTPAPVEFSQIFTSSLNDIKNSLMLLMVTMDGLFSKNRPVDADQQRDYASLHYEIQRVHNDLIQLQYLFRIKEKNLSVKKDQIYLADFIEEQLARSNILVTSRNIRIDLQCDHSLHWVFDEDLIGSIVNNVLVNTTRYTKDTIRISVYIEDSELHIVIEDNGQGYPDFMLKEDPTAHHFDSTMGSTKRGHYFALKLSEMHQARGKKGRIRLANGGSLNGGVYTLILP